MANTSDYSQIMPHLNHNNSPPNKGPKSHWEASGYIPEVSYAEILKMEQNMNMDHKICSRCNLCTCSCQSNGIRTQQQFYFRNQIQNPTSQHIYYQNRNTGRTARPFQTRWYPEGQHSQHFEPQNVHLHVSNSQQFQANNFQPLVDFQQYYHQPQAAEIQQINAVNQQLNTQEDDFYQLANSANFNYHNFYSPMPQFNSMNLSNNDNINRESHLNPDAAPFYPTVPPASYCSYFNGKISCLFPVSCG